MNNFRLLDLQTNIKDYVYCWFLTIWWIYLFSNLRKSNPEKNVMNQLYVTECFVLTRKLQLDNTYLLVSPCWLGYLDICSVYSFAHLFLSISFCLSLSENDKLLILQPKTCLEIQTFIIFCVLYFRINIFTC